MIAVGVAIDVAPVVNGLKGFEEQIPFAMTVALNRTGEDAYAALRKVVPEEFTVRDPRLVRVLAPVRLPPDSRATKQRPEVHLTTEGKARILAPFEVGEPKVMRTPEEPVAIPTVHLRSRKEAIVPRAFYPKNLGLQRKRDASGRSYYALGRGAIAKGLTPYKTNAVGNVVQIQGKRRTFVLDPRFHFGIRPEQWGVYERTGPNRGDIRMIWRYIDRVQRPRILRFEETIKEAVFERWGINAAGAVELALRTMRPR